MKNHDQTTEAARKPIRLTTRAKRAIGSLVTTAVVGGIGYGVYKANESDAPAIHLDKTYGEYTVQPGDRDLLTITNELEPQVDDQSKLVDEITEARMKLNPGMTLEEARTIHQGDVLPVPAGIDNPYVDVVLAGPENPR